MQCVEELSPEACFDLDEIEAVPVFDVPDFPPVAFPFVETVTTSATACTYTVTLASENPYDGVFGYAQSPFGLLYDFGPGECREECYEYYKEAYYEQEAQINKFNKWCKISMGIGEMFLPVPFHAGDLIDFIPVDMGGAGLLCDMLMKHDLINLRDWFLSTLQWCRQMPSCKQCKKEGGGS